MGNGMLEHVVFHWLRWGHIKECIEEDLWAHYLEGERRNEWGYEQDATREKKIWYWAWLLEYSILDTLEVAQQAEDKSKKFNKMGMKS